MGVSLDFVTAVISLRMKLYNYLVKAGGNISTKSWRVYTFTDAWRRMTIDSSAGASEEPAVSGL